ncbi:MAG: hypothetical protein JWO48_1480 [Bryobacterales bacterium]|nr:hypothetical protein [Bryobacterales bacterium]
MNPICNESSTHCQWVSNHWWSNDYELRSGRHVVAVVHVSGSRGVAELRNRRYTFERFRLPAYATIRDADTDALVARLELIPKRGFLAEFDDGQSFRLGWVNWCKREWTWTNESGETVLLSRHAWWPSRIELQIGPDGGAESRWPLLAILEFAVAKLALPWF